MLALEALLPYRLLMMETIYRQSVGKVAPNTTEHSQMFSLKASLPRMLSTIETKCSSPIWK